jgi:ABC-type multidrug transport system ATPase subunit
LISVLSVREHFSLFGEFRGLPQSLIKESEHNFCASLQMTEMLNNRAGDLSGSQKRKLCIALSLLGNPPIVLMDEPTAGVDIQSRQVIWKTIASLHDVATIVTSHALEEAEAVSSRLFIISKWHLQFTGTSTRLREQYNCRYLLRLEKEDKKINNVLEYVQSFIPNASLVPEKENCIRMPVCGEVESFLWTFDDQMPTFGVSAYSISVEALEDMLITMIHADEVDLENVQ